MGKAMTTKEKILSAAGDVFGAKGYNEATVREICSAAEVNLASINYHFGGKELLYRAVLEDILTTIIEKHPVVAAGQHTAEERFAFFIRAYINRLIGESRRPGNAGRMAMLSQEILNPSPVMVELMARHLYSQRDLLLSIVTELLGDKAGRADVLMCTMSSISQCFYMVFFGKTVEAMGMAEEASRIDLDSLARHAATFGLAGIRAIREGLEK